VVISDCRFPNEIAAIKRAGGKIFWVQRGQLPDWHHIAINANRGDNIAINELARLGIHSSEWAWIGTEFDAVIDNNGLISQLYTNLEQLINAESLEVSD
jgi:hypothetical protein